MKFGVVTFPGSNCDFDTVHVLRNELGYETLELWHKDHDLQNVDFVVLPGGFSYGDYLRSGAVARFSPIMQEVAQFAQKGGYVMGICNGFQVLCEANLLPGALTRNEDQKFICKNVHLSVVTSNSIITQGYDKNEVIKVPIAHAEGNFFIDDSGLEELNQNDQVLFKYCDENGNISSAYNPNGSVENIAGITNKGRNVFGMMPHPERASEGVLGNKDGRRVFEEIVQQVR